MLGIPDSFLAATMASLIAKGTTTDMHIGGSPVTEINSQLVQTKSVDRFTRSTGTDRSSTDDKIDKTSRQIVR